MVDVKVGSVVFSSSFDSGNLCCVSTDDPLCSTAPGSATQRSLPHHYFLQVSSDCEGTQYDVPFNRSWFYFSATWQGKPKDRATCKFTITNFAASNRVFDHDNRPVMRTESGAWSRLPKPLEVEIVDPDGNVKPLPDASAIVSPVAAGPASAFARKVTKRVDESSLRVSWQYTFAAPGETVYFAMCYPYSYAHLQKAVDQWTVMAESNPNIVFTREVLARSLQGRGVDLLTISDDSGVITGTASECFSNIAPLRLVGTSRPPRWEPFKRNVILTARVHPGETPASHVLHGMIDFLLSKDPRAAVLRQSFVFHIVPMINPDGVALGHYRTDSRGVNLNRCYDEPSLEFHPTIFAVRDMCRALGKEPAGVCCYLDLHAHASKRGCFVFANPWDDVDTQVSAMLLPKLFEINSPYFDFPSCDFTSRSMTTRSRVDGATKEGTGRVALAQESNIVHAYTFEASYNTGLSVVKQSCFTLNAYAEIGRSILVALLDFYQLNPKSKLSATPYKDVDGLRNALHGQFRAFLEAEMRQSAASTAPGGRRKAREQLAFAMALPALNSSSQRGLTRSSLSAGE